MNKKPLLLLTIISSLIMITGCSSPIYHLDESVTNASSSVNYEIFVASFYDSNNDGVGDLKGVELKLDYLQKLGVKNLWLMPIHPSQSYHKYNVDNYYGIDSSYGTMEDFESLVAKAKEKNIGILIDLVMNHSSNLHPWFIQSIEDVKNNNYGEGSKANYYIWKDSSIDGYRYNYAANKYYEAYFDVTMPDLNLSNPDVVKEFQDIAKFWIEKGVAGFRLDAIKHFYNYATDTNKYLKQFSSYCRSLKEDIFIVGEAFSEQYGELKSYFDSDISLFNFPSSGANTNSFVTAANFESGNANAKYIVSSNKDFSNMTTNNNYLCTFLTNHDQNRVSHMALDDKKYEMAVSSYILSKGVPFIYYGEEIGMKGTGIDENKRLHMIWSKNDKTGECKDPKNASFSESQQVENGVYDLLEDKNSLLYHYRKVINTRNKYNEYFLNGTFVYLTNSLTGVTGYEIYLENKPTLYVVFNYLNEDKDIDLSKNLQIVDEITKTKSSTYNNGILSIGSKSTTLLIEN